MTIKTKFLSWYQRAHSRVADHFDKNLTFLILDYTCHEHQVLCNIERLSLGARDVARCRYQQSSTDMYSIQKFYRQNHQLPFTDHFHTSCLALNKLRVLKAYARDLSPCYRPHLYGHVVEGGDALFKSATIASVRSKLMDLMDDVSMDTILDVLSGGYFSRGAVVLALLRRQKLNCQHM